MDTSEVAQAATLQRFIDAWKRWSAEDTISLFAESEDFRQVTMPFQMHVPERTRSEVQQTLPYVVRAVNNYDVSRGLGAQMLCLVTHDH
jgi:hypothetical protein